MTDPVLDYANKVIAGRIVAGPHVRNACARHLRDLARAPKRGLVWDPEAAMYVIRFFETVLLLNGGQFEGMPFKLQPSQKFQIGSIFGWKQLDGTRRFRRAYIEEAKGSGKSPIAAGVGLYCLIADNEARAEVYAAASKKDQAQVLFRDAVAMVRQSRRLSERIVTSGINPVWNLADLRTGSFFRPISNDDGQSGPRPSCALCDEIHEHRDSTVVEMLERGFKWRQQPLLMMITNAGSNRNSVCWQEHQHAVRVAAGVVDDDRTFSYVCAMDEGDDPLTDEKCWIKANPLLGVTVTRGYLRGVVKQACQIPAKMNNILRLHFCSWTDAENAWVTRETLERVVVPFETSDDYRAAIAEHQGKTLYVGVDLSATQDLTAEAFVVNTGDIEVERQNSDGSTSTLLAPTFDAWIEAWTPGDTIAERALRDAAQYDVWVREGWLNAPAGRNIRLDYPAAYLADVGTRFNIRWIAYDRYAFRKFEDELDELNFEAAVIEHPQGGKKRGALPPNAELTSAMLKRRGEEPPQGLWMPGSVLELEAMILERRIRLFGNPILISACMSAVFEEDPFGNRWFSKRRAYNRIDALVALAMAVGAATLDSTYDPKIDISAMVA